MCWQTFRNSRFLHEWIFISYVSTNIVTLRNVQSLLFSLFSLAFLPEDGKYNLKIIFIVSMIVLVLHALNQFSQISVVHRLNGKEVWSEVGIYIFFSNFAAVSYTKSRNRHRASPVFLFKRMWNLLGCLFLHTEYISISLIYLW